MIHNILHFKTSTTDVNQAATDYNSVPRSRKLSTFPSAGLYKLLDTHEVMEAYLREEIAKILKEKLKRKELIALATNAINKDSKFMNLKMRVSDLAQFMFFVEVIKGKKFRFQEVFLTCFSDFFSFGISMRSTSS